jgi:hypothetical protein
MVRENDYHLIVPYFQLYLKKYLQMFLIWNSFLLLFSGA